jgi:dipeptidyl aminopeptidase/acylaminoacyl peptidase
MPPLTFSPDGRYVLVYMERGLINLDRSESTLRIYSVGNLHKFLLEPGVTVEPSPEWSFSRSTYKDGPIITHIRWLPDSSGFAFLTKTEAGKDQLFLADLGTKTIRALTPKTQHVTGFDIHDRKHFVYTALSPHIGDLALGESQAADIVATGRSLSSLLFPDNLYPSMSRSHDLSELWAVVDDRQFRVRSKSSGQSIVLHSAGQKILGLSPDGRSVVTALTIRVIPPEWELLYPPPYPTYPFRIRARRQHPEALDGQRDMTEYVLIDLSTGKAKPLTNAPISATIGWYSGVSSADWSSDGKSIVLSDTFLPIKNVELEGQLNRPCITVVDLAKDSLTCLERLKGAAQTKSGWEDGMRFYESVRFDAGSRDRIATVYWEMGRSDQSTEEGSRKSTLYLRSGGDSWKEVTTKNGGEDSDNKIRIEVKESYYEQPVLVATDETGKKRRVILDPNPQLKSVDQGELAAYLWKDANGRDWVGGLYKPPDYTAGKRYPLVVQTHGFFKSLFRPSGLYSTSFAARELAAEGILVLQIPDCPFTSDSAEGLCNVAGYESGIDHLVAAGLVDPDRIGIVGFSRTCYYVLKVLTTNSLKFRAASITDGVNFGYFQYLLNVDSSGNTYQHEADGVIGTPPFGEGLHKWLKVSPDFNMEKITTPLQVVGLGRSSMLFMWEPYAALRYLNKPVDLIVVNSDEHVLTNPSARMVSQGGTVDWFRFWLQDYEDPDPKKQEQYERWRGLRKMQEENDAKEKAAKQKEASVAVN